MKTATIFFVVCAIAFASAADRYTTKYDNVNVDQILNNKRLLDNYMKCLLNKGRCNEDGATLKKYIPDALLTECSKCSDVQRQKGEKVIRFIAKNRPADWELLVKTYDPEGKYQHAYKKYLDQL